jgi:radical SAM protein with 4Fe4S-binding SPASM domain
MPAPSLPSIITTAWRHPLYLRHLMIKKLRTFARYRSAEAGEGSDADVGPPLGYKLVLTYRCNLRCVMCYEWGDVGWCHDDPRGHSASELDWKVIERLVEEASPSHPYFILHGGEPLLYSRFAELCALLRAKRCFAITCTNGMFLDRFPDITADNPFVTYLVSLDGLCEENDRLRGKGVYAKVTGNLERLRALRRPPYLGIQFTIRPENVHTMYEFCVRVAELGVDWVLLNPCWFVSARQGELYEQFMQQHFGITPRSHRAYLMPYDIDKDVYKEQMHAIRSRSWPMQISSYLERPEDIDAYVDTPEVPPGNSFCYQQWTRMDITPEGKVTPCILYPDLTFGNLHVQSAGEIWNSPAFSDFRDLRRRECLPVCAKCNALYLHDSRRRWL